MEVDPKSLEKCTSKELIAIIVELSRKLEEQSKRIEELERAAARPAAPFSKGTRKSNPKEPGRKGRARGDQGSFKRREAPQVTPEDHVEVCEAELEGIKDGKCPQCGKTLEMSVEEASTIDIPEQIARLIWLFHVHCARCTCGYRQRGKHPRLQAGQHGATAHRVGRRVKMLGHILHYGKGMPVRKVPEVIKEFCGIDIGQSALTQDAMKLGEREGAVGSKAEEIKNEIGLAERACTDDTGWKIGGLIAYLMGFGKEDAAYFQIRIRHRAVEVAEVIHEAFGGVLNTDRFSSYDAKRFDGVPMQKCLSHVQKNLSDLEKKKMGRAKCFASGLKDLLGRALEFWHRQRDGTISNKQYLEAGEELTQEITQYLRDRPLKDPENASMLCELRWHHERGNLVRFLKDPRIDPTNNFGERLLRPAVIARKVSHCSKNQRGADAYAAFKSVIVTFTLQQVPSLIQALTGILPEEQRSPTAAAR